MKKFIILLFALSLACVSCSDKQSGTSSANAGDGINVDENELPFGATMIDLDSERDGVPISISYEKRFMTEEEARKISDYISAVNSCDAELIKNTSYPSYLDYIVEYYGNTDIQDYLDSRQKNVEDTYTGGKFDFNYILVSSLKDENDDDSETGFSTLDRKILENSPDAEITSRKMVGIDVLYSLDGSGSYSLKARTGSDMNLYIYTIDGQMYIL